MLLNTSSITAYSITLFCLCYLCVKQQRPLLSEHYVTAETSPGQCSLPIGRSRSCDQNRIMAAAAAVRSSMGLTFRLSRVIPDCSTCPFYRLNSCGGNLQRKGSFDSFRTMNRHFQTSIGEWCSLLTPLASVRGWFFSLDCLFTISLNKFVFSY